MTIPVIPISGTRESFVSGKLSFKGRKPVLSDTIDFRTAIGSVYNKSNDIAILDVDGFRRNYLNSEIVKELRIKGRTVWFLTHIQTIDDVFDALCGSADLLAIPLDTVEPHLMEDANAISENVVPMLRFTNGVPWVKGDIPTIEAEMRSLSYRSILYFETSDCSLTHKDLEYL